MTASDDGLPFSVEAKAAVDGRVRLVLYGELDVASSPYLGYDLGRELEAGHDVELDVSQLSFIDSTGISVVLKAIDNFADEQRSLELAPELSDQVRRLLSLAGLLPILPFSDGHGPQPQMREIRQR